MLKVLQRSNYIIKARPLCIEGFTLGKLGNAQICCQIVNEIVGITPFTMGKLNDAFVLRGAI